MKKDTIYIDTEDDITSIIEKVKASGEKIIALVPPKRVGVLQSAVNLKLLQKSAQTADKRIVLITHDKALTSLAAGISIPVAKNLQSRPELAAVAEPEVDDGEDVINGEDLPVGDLEKTSTPSAVDPEDEIKLPDDLAEASPKSKTTGPKKSKGKKAGPKVPNFNTFRKKLFLMIGAGILLLVFLIWAIWFAPHATVNVKAKTTTESINFPVGLNVNGTTDAKAKVIKPAVEQIKKTSSADFSATGKKDIGTKATGTVTISNCDTFESFSLPAGTAVSSNGLNFLTASTVTIPGAKGSFSSGCTKAGTASVSVQAQNMGEEYNVSGGSNFTVAGQSSRVSGNNPNSFSGGSKRTINVVSDGDIATAQTKLIAQNGEAGRTELTDKFDSKKYVIIDKSYKAEPSAATSSPASGNEGTKGHLTVEITYTLLAMSKDDVNGVLDAYLKDKIAQQKDQKIYDNGLSKLKLENYSDTSVSFKTNGYIGPAIDEAKLKPQLVGKNYEDIRQKIKTIDGVDDVDTKFFPFWVSTAPDAGKIDIKFVVQKNG